MGDTKFLPNLNAEKFDVIIKASRAYKLQTDNMEKLWSKSKNSVYHLTERTKSLGLGENGITTYFSDNCTQEVTIVF